MKTALLVVCCVFCSSAAFAQAVSSVSSQATPVVMVDHPQHASQHEMAQPQDIFVHSNYSYAQGERPLWEFGPISQPVPLGDVARENRKQQVTVRKSEILWEN